MLTVLVGYVSFFLSLDTFVYFFFASKSQLEKLTKLIVFVSCTNKSRILHAYPEGVSSDKPHSWLTNVIGVARTKQLVVEKQ